MSLEFTSLQRKWNSVNWELVHNFEVDCWLYKREFSHVVAHLQSKKEPDSLSGSVAQLKLSSCLANTGNLRVHISVHYWMVNCYIAVLIFGFYTK
jgi:hypothetical protein